ncbi:LapA family protein [Achromobacter ruhlandii]|uniref:LapA family protein n=1 Tax=Achromobacter ruhlandii TaxID=72557 RepID=UPI0009F5EB7E|nr:LapA family protein [Achromobacter ruhlandii]
MSELDEIVKEHKRNRRTLSEQTFHVGCILLASLVMGLLLSQTVDMPAGITASDEKDMRLALALQISAAMTLVLGVAYVIGTWLRIRKAIRQTNKKLLEASLKAIQRKE